MLKAILIADQQRLHALVAASLGGSGVQLIIISSLASGIEQAAATPPDLLFVQGRLSGLSAEIVSRHVSTHVDQTRTRLVIFVEPGEEPAASRNQFHLDLALPDSALENRISALVKAAQPFPTSPDTDFPVAVADEFIPDRSLSGQKISLEATARAGTTQESDGVSPLPSKESVIATRFEAELETELARREDGLRPVKSQESGEPERAASRHPSVGQAEADELASLSRRRVVTIVAAVFLLAAAAAVVQLMPASRTQAPGKVPATIKPALPIQTTAAGIATTTPPPAPAPTAKPIEALRDPLPSFVPGDRRDPAYATANPGWERYQDTRHEYKVFWEKGKLKAVQVIDRSGSGLSPTFFTAAMKELAGVRDYRLASREAKDNYLIKKGTLGKAGSIIIYKNKADSVLQAFVIHFDQGKVSRR